MGATRRLTKIFFLALSGALGAFLLVAQRADTQHNPFAGDAKAAEAGKLVYNRTCQVCHGGEARGDRGPALASGKFEHGGEDDEIFGNIRNGIQGTQMPAFPKLPADDIWRLITYFRSLSGTLSATDETVPGSVAAGEKIFFGKGACSNCHQVNERGIAVGPDLSEAGKDSAESLRRNILEPNSKRNQMMRLFGIGRTAVGIKTKEGREIIGMKHSEDTFNLVMTDMKGNVLLLDKQDLVEEHTPGKSLHPDSYEKQFSASELQDVIAYLKSLKERDFRKTESVDMSGGVSFERIRDAQAEPWNWLTYWGNYQGHHFSDLKQITKKNVGQLQARWAAQLPGPSVVESTPLVVDRVMYTSGSPGQVFALDARSGLQIWNYQRKQKVINPYQTNPFNRGVAVLNNRVFFGTLDSSLVALNATTGLPVWETSIADTLKGYTVTAAPLAIKDKIIIGVAGGEFGIRGFLDAYDARTGKRVWRFDAIPGPGEFGHDTWSGDSWKHGSGGTWLTGSYDAESNTLYWGVGNPGPDINAEVRRGDNLFTCSVVALDASSGQRKWHYQFTPGDSHDWDATEDLILTDGLFAGVQRKLLLQADRNGMFYVLDRGEGKLLRAEPFVHQSWNKGFDKEGRPILTTGWDSSPTGNVVAPDLGGATNWQAPSFDSERGVVYVAFHESSLKYIRTAANYEEGRTYMGGTMGPGGDEQVSGIRAIDSVTGKVRWEYRLARQSLSAGVLATAGEVVFAATAEGNVIALDASTGKALWHFQTGASISSAPISYGISGKQYVAIAAGSAIYSFALPE